MLHFYPPLRFEYRLLLRSVNSAEPHGDPSLPSKCTQPLWNSDSHSCPVLAAKEESEKCSAAAALLAGSGTSCLACRKALVHLVLYTVPFKTCQALAKTALLHPKWQHFLLRNSCSNWLCPAPDSGFYWDIFTRRLPTVMLWWQSTISLTVELIAVAACQRAPFPVALYLVPVFPGWSGPNPNTGRKLPRVYTDSSENVCSHWPVLSFFSKGESKKCQTPFLHGPEQGTASSYNGLKCVLAQAGSG